MSAVIQNEYTGNNSTTTYSFTFPYLKTSDIKASLDGVATTAFTLPNATTLQFNTAPANGAKIKIFRETSVDDLTATFYAGSAIKSEDLNDNFTQNLYKTQEVGTRSISSLGGTMTGDLNFGTQAQIVFEGATDDAHETTLAVTDPTADRTITLPNVTGTVVTTGDTGTVATAMIAGDAVTGAKIADDQINSEHYVDGSIDTQHIADAQVTTAKIADSNVTTAKLADNAVTNAKVATNAISTVTIIDANVTRAKIADDAINGTKIADNSIDSEHYVDGSIDNAHLADNSVTLAKMADDSVGTAELVDGSVDTARLADNSVTLAKMTDNSVGTSELVNDSVTKAKIADDQIDSEHYVDQSIDSQHLADNAVTNAKLADDAVGSNELGDGVIDTVHIGTAQITNSLLASNAVTEAKITDANVTEAKLAANSVTISKIGCEQTTLTDSDSHIPTSGAVVDYVYSQIAPIGGLEVIANEVSFPNSAPATGVVISISDAGGIVVNSSGTSTTARTLGGSTVTIEGFPSSLYSETLAAGIGLMVSKKHEPAHSYIYHKILGKEEDIKQLSDDINDFQNRYRVGSTNPTSSLDNGDLFFNTGTGKMLVYNGTNTAWEEVQSIGNFFISTFSEAFDGSRTQFTLSNAPTNVQQVLLSLNGVIQKPGTAFTLSGSTVTLASAPASGTDYFAVVMGSAVNIGTPSNNTVSTAILQDDSVTAAKIAAGAVGSTELAANAVITSKITDAQITTPKINDTAVTNAKLADDAVTTAKITDAQITTAKINDDAVTAAKLANTSVTAGSYGSSTAIPIITVDAQGRITAANSSGINTDVVGDTSPQLGGDLASNGHDIKIADATGYDGNNLYMGSDNDTRIIHDGSNFSITEATGDVTIQAADDIFLKPQGGENGIKVIGDGAVELYHDNSKKFETTSVGFTAGTLSTDSTGAYMKIKDTSSYGLIIEQGASKNITLRTDGPSIQFYQATNGEYFLRCLKDAAVELYYNGSKKFETTNTGVTITGHHKKANTNTPAWSLRPNGNSNATLGNSATLVGWTPNSSSGNHGKNNFLIGGCTLSGPGSGTDIHGGNSVGRLNVPVKGIYQITATIRMENNPEAQNIYLLVNGSTIERQHVEMWAHRPYMHGRISGSYLLEADDYVEIKVHCNGGTFSGYNDTVNWFKGHLVQAIT